MTGQRRGPRMPGEPHKRRPGRRPAAIEFPALRGLGRNAPGHVALARMSANAQRFGVEGTLRHWAFGTSNQRRLLRAPLADGALRRWCSVHGLELDDASIASILKI